MVETRKEPVTVGVVEALKETATVGVVEAAVLDGGGSGQPMVSPVSTFCM